MHSGVHEPGGVERFTDGFSEILLLIFDFIGKEALLQLAFLVFRTHLILILVIFNKIVCMLNINNLSSQVYMSFQKWNKKELDFMFGLVALSGGVFFDFLG